MPQKKKAKTKKEMKKSIGNLYDALQKEKGRHARASDLIARSKWVTCNMLGQIQQQQEQISTLKERIDKYKYDEKLTSEVTANLIRKLN